MEDTNHIRSIVWKSVILSGLIILNVIALAVQGVYFARNNSANKQYPLLAGRIQRENPPNILINFTDLNSQITNYLDKAKVPYSVYFEYLPTGTSIDTGTHNELVGASLMKLPIVMNLYKAYETGTIKPTDTIDLKEEWLNQDFGDLWKRGAGAKITYQEAAQEALVNSDNTAILAIVNSAAEDVPASQQSLEAIDANVHYDNDGKALITADMYASVLKCLYFSCFLEKEHSQEIMNYLTQSTGNYLASDLPDSVKVAHKLGQWGEQTTSDCGIVYVPSRPYILCVMVADSSANAINSIKTVSKMAYDFVSSANAKPSQ